MDTDWSQKQSDYRIKVSSIEMTKWTWKFITRWKRRSVVTFILCLLIIDCFYLRNLIIIKHSKNGLIKVSIYKHSIYDLVREPSRPDSTRPLREISLRERNLPFFGIISPENWWSTESITIRSFTAGKLASENFAKRYFHHVELSSWGFSPREISNWKFQRIFGFYGWVFRPMKIS